MISRGGFSHSRGCTSGIWGRFNTVSTAVSCAVAATEIRRSTKKDPATREVTKAGRVEILHVDKTPAYRDTQMGSLFPPEEIRRGLYLAEVERTYAFLGLVFDWDAWKNTSPPPGWEPKGGQA
jgi:hypothetical protein